MVASSRLVWPFVRRDWLSHGAFTIPHTSSSASDANYGTSSTATTHRRLPRRCLSHPQVHLSNHADITSSTPVTLHILF